MVRSSIRCLEFSVCLEEGREWRKKSGIELWLVFCLKRVELDDWSAGGNFKFDWCLDQGRE